MSMKVYASEESLKNKLIKCNYNTKLPSGMEGSLIAYGNNMFVAVKRNTNKYYYSYDGINWLESELSNSFPKITLTYGNGRFVALMSNGKDITYSYDGINWFKSTITSKFIERFDMIICNNGIFIAISSYENYFCYSYDCINWYESSGFSDSLWDNAAYYNGVFVVCGASYRQTPITPVANASENNNDGNIIYGADNWITNNIAWSHDGINWKFKYEDKFNAPYLTSCKNIAYGNGKFVILANESTTGVYSTDGENWTQLTLPSYVNIDSLVFGDGKFLVFTSDGCNVLISRNGINWNLYALETQYTVNSITYGSGRFIATLTDTVDIIVSYDGVNWFKEENGLYQGNNNIASMVKEILSIPTVEDVTNEVLAALPTWEGGSY